MYLQDWICFDVSIIDDGDNSPSIYTIEGSSRLPDQLGLDRGM